MSIIQFYEHKKELLLEIKKITLRMDEALKAGEIETFLGLINERQKFIDNVELIDKCLPEYDNPDNMGGGIASNNAAKEEVKFIIKEIKVLNDRINSEAIKYYNEVRSNIKNMGNARRAMNSYIKKNPQVCGFFIENKK